jgi:Protein of unknown function (DUF2975)
VSSRRPAHPASIGYGIVTFFLGLTLIGGVYAVGWAAVGAVRGDHSITLDRTAPPDQLASLPPQVKPTDRCCAVTQTINDATPLQLLLWTASDLIVLALGFVGLWQLRGLLGSVRHGDPFHAANVRRLRWFGWLLMLGYPAVALASSLLKESLGSTMSEAQPLLGNSAPAVNLAAALLAGLAVLVLAEVFAHGVRLREDVEGTI